MSWKTSATLAVVLLLSITNPALAEGGSPSETMTTQALYEACRSDDPSFCYGYVTGIARAMRDIQALDMTLLEDFCPEHLITARARSDQFLAWAEAHRNWDRSAYHSVYLALMFGEPCAVQIND